MNATEDGSFPNGSFQDFIEEYRVACNVTEEVREGLCPGTFDGWSCWNETAAGDTAYNPCPSWIVGFDSNLKAHKECLSDGTWFRHPESNQTWSNYTTCVNQDNLARLQTVNLINQFGYLLSLSALMVSLVIFFSSLHCPRVTVHKHLFVSFITCNTIWLVWYKVITTPELITADQGLVQTGCAILHILNMYFILANYFWMLCEGIYLLSLTVCVFRSGEWRLVKGLYLIGWGCPVIPVSFYGYMRATDEDLREQEHCWINESKHFFIISIPVCICLILSLVFLVNILRVILFKLGSVAQSRRDLTVSDHIASVLKATKATLILVPLLGLHYFLIPFRPDTGSAWEASYSYVAAVFTSFQGLAVAVIFCFCNEEVKKVLRRKFSRKGGNSGSGQTAETRLAGHPGSNQDIAMRRSRGTV